jgi:hypothetical protein
VELLFLQHLLVSVRSSFLLETSYLPSMHSFTMKNVLRLDFELSPFSVFRLRPDLGVEEGLLAADAVDVDGSNGPS